MDEVTSQQIWNTITRLEHKVDSRKELDSVWADIKQIFLNELNRLPDIPPPNSKKGRKKLSQSKSFWNEELNFLWKQSCTAEKKYLHLQVTWFRLDINIIPFLFVNIILIFN